MEYQAMDQEFGIIELPPPSFPLPLSTPPPPSSSSQPTPQFLQAGLPKWNYRLPARYEDFNPEPLQPTIQLLFDVHHHHDHLYSIQRWSIHIHGHHQQHRLYLIQWPVSTSMVTANSIICIWYNVPHPWSPLLWSFVFDTMILWSSWCLSCSLHSSPSSQNEVLTSSGLQHLCLALAPSDLLKPNDSMNLADAWWRCRICYHPSVCTSLEFFHLRLPHGWNDIADQCASSLHGIYCPLQVWWLLDCHMRWWVVFLLLLKSLS